MKVLHNPHAKFLIISTIVIMISIGVPTMAKADSFDQLIAIPGFSDNGEVVVIGSALNVGTGFYSAASQQYQMNEDLDQEINLIRTPVVDLFQTGIIGGFTISANFDNTGAFGGGIATLTLGVPSLGIPNGTVVLGGPLIAGEFVDSVPGLFDLSIGQFVFEATTKNALLGISSDLIYISTQHSGPGPLGFTSDFATGGFTESVAFSVRRVSEPIPEPSTMLLFGSGLAGLVAWRSRKSRNP